MLYLPIQNLKQFLKIASHRCDTKWKLPFTFAILQGYTTGVAFDVVYCQMLKVRFHWCNFYGESHQWNPLQQPRPSIHDSIIAGLAGPGCTAAGFDMGLLYLYGMGIVTLTECAFFY
jgi:hypothetical protein